MEHSEKGNKDSLASRRPHDGFPPSCVHPAARFGFIPLIIYFLIFCLLTWPLITMFSTHFFTDRGDGLQNIWNMWWVDKAITGLHQSPWHTTWLEYPHGTSLLGHTLNPFNGFLVIGLLRVFTLLQAFNICVIFSFIVGGLTAFWLAWHLSRSYAGSLVAGFIFTFSNYHFSHAEGHLQLTSLEWIPLFILCWHVLMTKPSVRMGIFSALALFGVILCDYYYFLYSVVTAMFIYAWKALREHDFLFALRRGRRGALAAFAAGTVGMSGSLIVPLLLLNRRDPLQGSHRPELFSLDLLAPLIPGGHWRFAAWTEGYWSKLPGNIHESSVHLGLSLILALALIWIGRRKVGTEGLALWYVLLIAFMILSLGPTLNIWGKTIPGIKLPYSWLESVFPPLRLGGTPVRMMVVPLLAAAVIFALGFRDVLVSTKGRRVMTACLLIMMGFEYLPKPMPRTRIEVPAYVYALRKLDGAGGVLDLASPTLDMMYFQTIHGKPLAFGYLARLPASVDELNGRIAGLVRSGEFGLLARRDRFRWLVAPGWPPRSTDTGALMVVFDDGNVRIYEIRG